MMSIAALFHVKGRSLVILMALTALGLGSIAVVLANVLRLDACHLCIFQRLAYFVISVFLLTSFFVWDGFLLRNLSLACSSAFCLWGLVVSAQQSWLQWFPDSALTCNMGQTGLAEQFIDWLGQLYPLFFMATGFCGSKDLVILGLSLANWSFLILLAFFVGCVGLMIFSRNTNRFR